MKIIKRTITLRKIEIIGSSSHIHEAGMAICPLCNSKIDTLPAANNVLELEQTAVKTQIKSNGGNFEKTNGEKND